MRTKLRYLYELQKIDTHLDEIRELRGDLPEQVAELQAQVETLGTKISEIDDFLKHGAVERQRKEKDSIELMEKIEKYKAQQLQVRTNKEYDALTKEIDGSNEKIKLYEDEIERYADMAQEKKAEREEFAAQKELLDAEFAEKKQELDEILASTEREETTAANRRAKIVARIEDDDLAAYTRIRDAKRGKVVMPIRRGSCSGCYNVVPPQFILMIKKNDKVYLCEHCGRILVSEEIATDTTPLL